MGAFTILDQRKLLKRKRRGFHFRKIVCLIAEEQSAQTMCSVLVAANDYDGGTKV